MAATGEEAASAAVASPTASQTMQGFGASGAWWPIDLVHFSPDVREKVAELLFGPDGLALSVYRYNIGGGGVGVKNPLRAPETFLVSPGVYDWGRDPGGRLFLRAAAEMGVPVLVGFVNSAPAVWKTNGACCGGQLAPGAEGEYARYLADVVAGLQAAEGATLSYVSPMNEPDYTFSECGQEGMAVPVSQRATVVRALAEQLARRAPFAQVIADESSRALDQFLPEAPVWLGVEGGTEAVAALAHHLYDFPNDLDLSAVNLAGAVSGKPLWMTEICCFDSRTGRWGRQYDPTIAGAMPLANLVWQSLAIVGDSAFHWWVALSSAMGCDPFSDPAAAGRPNDEGWNDGLIYYDHRHRENGNERLYVTKRFWALANFSRYVRPGDVRHDVQGLPEQVRGLAFHADRGWAVIAINNAAPGSPPTHLGIRLPLRSEARFEATALETSASRDLEPVADPILQAEGLLTATVPPQSITTLLLTSP